MIPSNRLTTFWACALLLLLTGCASIPTGFEQVPSQTWQHPEQTELGTFFDEFAPADRSLSGVRLISNPKEAFRARFGFAALAEKVHVRLLIDDIFHSGRDISYGAGPGTAELQLGIRPTYTFPTTLE